MTELQQLIALILPEFLEFLDIKKTSENQQKRLDIPKIPSITCDQGGIKYDC